MYKGIKALLPVVLLVSATTLAQEGTSLQSDWLELVKGHKGDALGVELREIEAGEEEGSRTVTLAVPKTSIEHPDAIEEVVVVGRKPDDPEPLNIKYEWVSDYDDDNYGLIIHLGDSNWPIRLYMNSSPGFTR
jgi:hypothetical protein